MILGLSELKGFFAVPPRGGESERIGSLAEAHLICPGDTETLGAEQSPPVAQKRRVKTSPPATGPG